MLAIQVMRQIYRLTRLILWVGLVFLFSVLPVTIILSCNIFYILKINKC